MNFVKREMEDFLFGDFPTIYNAAKNLTQKIWKKVSISS